MRMKETNLYSNSLEANIQRTRRGDDKSPGRMHAAEPKLTTAITAALNPFYDKAKNPFGDDEEVANDDIVEEAGLAGNPFGDSNEYDDNLNPFA